MTAAPRTETPCDSIDPVSCSKHFHHPDLGVMTVGSDGPHWLFIVLFTVSLGVLFVMEVY